MTNIFFVLNLAKKLESLFHLMFFFYYCEIIHVCVEHQTENDKHFCFVLNLAKKLESFHLIFFYYSRLCRASNWKWQKHFCFVLNLAKKLESFHLMFFFYYCEIIHVCVEHQTENDKHFCFVLNLAKKLESFHLMFFFFYYCEKQTKTNKNIKT